ncbi:MAG: hypothetical protein J6M64_04840, partial [Oscillospiraceae bacterium]|nr:hypothetical protein [Oscillospiraceae bacterium]
MICIWNQNNKIQISSYTHIPFYVNLQQHQDKAVVTTKEESLQLGAILYVGTEDQDQRPHFHYERCDYSDVAISLLEPVYMIPAENALNAEELRKLVALLEKDANGESLYQRLIEWWNCQNQTQLDDSIPIPSYCTMKTSDNK